MTREEKIELLNKLLEIEGKNDIGNLTRAERGEFQQWINDAIEQESCDKCVYSTKDGYCQYDDITEAIPPFEPCEDAISRRAVEDAIAETIVNGESLGYAIAQEIVSDLPPVKPQEPKTGHWEWVQYDYNPKIGNWHCTECRCVVVECVDKNEKGGIPLYKYCPQCGAKMIEPQESEDKE